MLKRAVNARGERCTWGNCQHFHRFSLNGIINALNQPVTISTPNVEAINVRHYDGVPVPFVILNVDFVEGLKNENVFVFTKDVALTMVDLMMMGTGRLIQRKSLVN